MGPLTYSRMNELNDVYCRDIELPCASYVLDEKDMKQSFLLDRKKMKSRKPMYGLGPVGKDNDVILEKDDGFVDVFPDLRYPENDVFVLNYLRSAVMIDDCDMDDPGSYDVVVPSGTIHPDRIIWHSCSKIFFEEAISKAKSNLSGSNSRIILAADK